MHFLVCVDSALTDTLSHMFFALYMCLPYLSVVGRRLFHTSASLLIPSFEIKKACSMFTYAVHVIDCRLVLLGRGVSQQKSRYPAFQGVI